MVRTHRYADGGGYDATATDSAHVFTCMRAHVITAPNFCFTARMIERSYWIGMAAVCAIQHVTGRIVPVASPRPAYIYASPLSRMAPVIRYARCAHTTPGYLRFYLTSADTPDSVWVALPFCLAALPPPAARPALRTLVFTRPRLLVTFTILADRAYRTQLRTGRILTHLR